MSKPTDVILISAPWCKRCHELKPEIAAMCAIAGRNLVLVDYDSLEDDDPQKKRVTSLPTILMDGAVYTAATLDAWKTAASVSAFTGTDF
jgi:thiol-disulfide isomerase/thioredoxin